MSISWGDLIRHSWPPAVSRKLSEARSAWTLVLRRQHLQEGKGTLEVEPRLMLRAVSYASWLSVYTDFPLESLVVDFSHWLRDPSVEPTTQEDSLRDMADEFHESRGRGISMHPFDLHCAISDACDLLGKPSFLRECMDLTPEEPPQKVDSGALGRATGTVMVTAAGTTWASAASRSPRVPSPVRVLARPRSDPLSMSSQPELSLADLKARLPDSVDRQDFLEAARLQALIQEGQLSGLNVWYFTSKLY